MTQVQLLSALQLAEGRILYLSQHADLGGGYETKAVDADSERKPVEHRGCEEAKGNAR